MSIKYINTLPTCGIHGCPIHAASHCIYTFDISPEEIFSRTCNRSLVHAKRNGTEDPNLVIGKDSRDFFNDWLDMALANLQLQFARFQREEDIISSDGKIYDTDGNEVEFNPWMTDTETGDYQVSLILTKANDKNVVAALPPLVADYLIKYVLEQFYGEATTVSGARGIRYSVDFDWRGALQRITDVLNYQAAPARIKTSPF